MRRINYNKNLVYCVGGEPYYMNYAIQTIWGLIFLPAVVALVLDDWHHLLGTLMVILGAAAANARFSPVHGCLVWLPIIGLAIWAVSRPELALPLIGWGVLAWVAGCIECRLTLVPAEEFADDSEQPSAT